MTADKDWQNAFDSLRDNIEDIKETIRVDVKGPLKELTKVISSLAVQEEKIDSINKRLTVTERSLKEVWCSYYELREDYSKRECNASPQDWWNGRVAEFFHKAFWISLSAVIGWLVGMYK